MQQFFNSLSPDLQFALLLATIVLMVINLNAKLKGNHKTYQRTCLAIAAVLLVTFVSVLLVWC